MSCCQKYEILRCDCWKTFSIVFLVLKTLYSAFYHGIFWVDNFQWKLQAVALLNKSTPAIKK